MTVAAWSSAAIDSVNAEMVTWRLLPDPVTSYFASVSEISTPRSSACWLASSRNSGA